MLRKRKEPKAEKGMIETLMRDMQGGAAEKLEWIGGKRKWETDGFISSTQLRSR